MRQIKFRAWDKVLKQIESWNGLTQVYSSWFITQMGEPEDHVTLMEFTGLIDKNGKEIYEGDIVQKFGIDDDNEAVEFGEIAISHDFLGVGFYCRDKFGQQGNIFGGSDIEIIGNIYENPELLKS